MVRLVIWDLDETLVNTLQCALDALSDGIAETIGRRIDPQELLDHWRVAGPEAVAPIVGSDRAAECLRRTVFAGEHRLREARAHDDVIETLDALERAGLRSGLFTRRERRTTDLVLESSGLSLRFAVTVAGDEVSRSKPDPEGIHKICRSLDVMPRDTIMVGDSPEDIAAAKAAGAGAIGCVWSRGACRKALMRAGPARVIAHPGELLALVVD